MVDRFLVGRKGSGKTLLATEEVLFDWYEGHEIWGNIWFHDCFDKNFITGQRGNKHYVDAIDLIRLLVDDSDALKSNLPKTLILDEMKSQANARNFTSWVNRNLTDFISQSRKRNFKVIYTDQILAGYDRWIRQMTDQITICNAIIDPNDIGLGTNQKPEPMYFERFDIIKDDLLDDFKPGTISLRSRENARMIYPLYDTTQIVTPVELKYDLDGEKP